jgi:predicted nucleotidyltransferase
MVKRTNIKEIKEDFSFLEGRILGVVVFGSFVKKELSEKSDVDICIVSPDVPPSEILREVFRNLDVVRKGYDVKVFEELPLYLKAEVIKHYIVVLGDPGEIAEYFRVFWKIWKDQEHRQKLTKEELKRLLTNKSL